MWLIVLLCLICTAIYFVVKKKQSYWSERGVKQQEQKFLIGASYDFILRKEPVFEALNKIYQAFPEERYIGFYEFLRPMLLLRDPDLIKQLLVKDFDHFVNHRDFLAEGAEPLWSKNLFSLQGNRWRDMRATLSPSFTSSKMRLLFNLISESTEDFLKFFLNKEEPIITVELKDTCTRFTNDVIANVVFGVKCNSLEDRDNDFYLMGREATQIFNGFKNIIKFSAISVFPKLCKILGVTIFSERMKTFFTALVTENIQMREKQGLKRQDMLHLLLEARKDRNKQEEGNQETLDAGFATVQESNTHFTRKTVKDEITDLDIAAQALIFFFAGFETVSTLMCFIGYELAINPDIQKKLQEEIDATLKTEEEKLNYEALVKMKYMDMVVSEALRKWSPSTGTDRVCVKPYTIEPVKNGEKPVYLNVGDIFWVPTTALHRDSKYFPNPEVFDPERFNEESRESIKQFSYLPFGGGPRNCIGSRFALLEVKTLYFHLLSKFDLMVVEKTEIPLKLNKTSFSFDGENGIWIGLKARSK